MAKKHKKRCSISLIIGEMQSKATVKYYLTPVRMVIIKKYTNNKFWKGCGKKEPLYTWWEYKLVQLLWRNMHLSVHINIHTLARTRKHSRCPSRQSG